MDYDYSYYDLFGGKYIAINSTKHLKADLRQKYIKRITSTHKQEFNEIWLNFDGERVDVMFSWNPAPLERMVTRYSLYRNEVEND